MKPRAPASRRARRSPSGLFASFTGLGDGLGERTGNCSYLVMYLVSVHAPPPPTNTQHPGLWPGPTPNTQSAPRTQHPTPNTRAGGISWARCSRYIVHSVNCEQAVHSHFRAFSVGAAHAIACDSRTRERMSKRLVVARTASRYSMTLLWSPTLPTDDFRRIG